MAGAGRSSKATAQARGPALLDKATGPTESRPPRAGRDSLRAATRRGACRSKNINSLRAASEIADSKRKLDGRRERGQRRQQAVIDAARDLFVQHGYHGTTLQAIIARAGGSRETIYRQFGGKSGLFSAIISKVGEQLAGSILTPGALELPPREALTRVGVQLVAIWQSAEGRAVNKVVLAEGLNSPELVDAWYHGGIELTVRALTKYLEAQSRAGLSGMDASLMARQYLMLLMAEMGYPIISQTPQPTDPLLQIERCVTLILRAYAFEAPTAGGSKP